MGKTGGSCSSFKTKLLIFDSFGRPFVFMLPNGQKMYKSLIGALLTVCAITFVAFYAVYKWDVLVSQEETAVQVTVEENVNTEPFTSNDGFHLAIGISSDFG